MFVAIITSGKRARTIVLPLIKLQYVQGRQLNETRNKLCPVRLVRHKFHLNLYNYSHTKVSEPILGGGGVGVGSLVFWPCLGCSFEIVSISEKFKSKLQIN